MSGEAYDCAYRKIEHLADVIRAEGSSCEDYAASREKRMAFKKHLRKVALAVRAIDWNDSGDGDSSEVERIDACLTSGEWLAIAVEEGRRIMTELHAALEAANP